MKTALHTLSNEELIELAGAREQEYQSHLHLITTQEKQLAVKDGELVAKQDRILTYEARVFDLEFQIAQLQRLIFGAKRERFISDVHASQLSIGFVADETAVEVAVAAEMQKVAYERSKPSKKHEGRMELPAHLPVQETVIEPSEDVSGMTCIGREVTDELELTPAVMVINRTSRPKYAAPESADGSVLIVIAPMPKRVIDKCIAGPELLTTITTDKHVYHMPIDRQLKRFSMLGIDIPSSTVESWQKLTAELLRPLHAALRSLMLQTSYLQVDETGLAVQDRTKQGTTHKGFLWGYRAPLINAVFFDYRKGRGQLHCHEMLENFTGYLQSDDYQIYHQHKARADVIGVACMAHARRNFDKALGSDRARASIAMKLIQKLYAVEQEARDRNLTAHERKELRLEKSLPVLNTISAWLVQELQHTLPKSPIGKAIRYAVRLWDELMAYLYNGHLEIDNNLIENTIRPVAIGRKNWLFAGSHEGAENIAMYRSFFGTCQLNGINPHHWLRYVLTHINSTAPAKYHTLLPHNIDSALLA